jgi:acetyl-CoA carboxylase biotin carboxylase subunit
LFKKLLIANRGEIACRVIRACRELGVRAVAVYSEADRAALHVARADEAYCIGPAPPLESYLNIEKIIETAKQAKCEAVHPGYGFLAENGAFADACAEAGLVFIGPSGDTLRLAGDKLGARRTMTAAGIPIIPGMAAGAGDAAEVLAEAKRLGYPVMVKAAGGGGGKGMRVVTCDGELEECLDAARREALGAFGDDTVYLEKYVERPRHVEFQILADARGNVVHLFERECSIQRRHQKIVEESPSPALDAKLRKKMGEAACEVARAVGYTNAGTVEFLLDENKNFYFLEVNARVQVEHPVTEMVTGVDIVKAQLAIAAGGDLPFAQKDLSQRGHAVECRIYAEDPAANFLPSAGKILFLREPRGPGVRLDGGIYGGYDVPVYYDPILAKLITWGADREEARRRMAEALREYVIIGIGTTIPFLRDVIDHPAYVAGETNTGFVADHFDGWREAVPEGLMEKALAAAAVAEMAAGPAGRYSDGGSGRAAGGPTPWQTVGPWEIGRGA